MPKHVSNVQLLTRWASGSVSAVDRALTSTPRRKPIPFPHWPLFFFIIFLESLLDCFVVLYFFILFFIDV